ncbi:MAG: hypothetical protein KAV99_07145 [Candidatus Latescibacteria bacterium]|nr:hypothetical protein [Candidatus Latescibacterota bacterium]
MLAVDNIDKAPEEEQETLIKEAVRLFRSNRVKLIVPLRKTSRLIRDKFSALHEQPFAEIDLLPVDLEEALRIRFSKSRDGVELSASPVVKDGNRKFTYPELCDLIFSGPAGDLLKDIAAADMRIALKLVRQLLESDQLKGLLNLRDPEFVLASWMLNDVGEVDPVSPILLNLFDSEEPLETSPGYALIRYRLLEHLIGERVVDLGDVESRTYFERLGYNKRRMRKTTITFLRAGLVFSKRGVIPDFAEDHPEMPLGPVEISRTGRAYWEKLLKMLWYYVTVKRATRLPIDIIKTEAIKTEPYERQYVTHTSFVKWLKEQEDDERLRIRSWEGRYAQKLVSLSQPYLVAKAVLRPEDNEDGQGAGSNEKK